MKQKIDKINHQNDHFDSIAEKYYEARQDSKHLLYKSLLLDYMLSELSISMKKRGRIAVIEPMCGYGEGKSFVERYISDNIDYEGFDFNETLIRKVKENFPDINIYKEDVTKFDTDKKYDIVILIGGLHHVPDYAEYVIKKIGKILKTGGVFINFEPTHNNIFIALARLFVYKLNAFFDDATEHDFSLGQLNNMYRAAGLRIYRQYYPGLLGYILWYNPDAFPLLNIGTESLVKRVFNFEKKLISGKYGRFVSFTTFSVLVKAKDK